MPFNAESYLFNFFNAVAGRLGMQRNLQCSSDSRFSEYIPSNPLIGFGFLSCFEKNKNSSEGIGAIYIEFLPIK